MMFEALASLAALAIIQAAAPAAVPRAAIIIAAPQGERAADRQRELVDQTSQVILTMQDLGLIDVRYANSDWSLASCIEIQDEEERANCIGRVVPIAEAGMPLVTLLIEDMRWRSAAQQMTCISSGGKRVERTPIHLRDRFHGRADIRQGVRDVAARCLAGALTNETAD